MSLTLHLLIWCVVIGSDVLADPALTGFSVTSGGEATGWSANLSTTSFNESTTASSREPYTTFFNCGTGATAAALQRTESDGAQQLAAVGGSSTLMTALRNVICGGSADDDSVASVSGAAVIITTVIFVLMLGLMFTFICVAIARRRRAALGPMPASDWPTPVGSPSRLPRGPSYRIELVPVYPKTIDLEAPVPTEPPKPVVLGMCTVCHERHVDTLFLPCGHFCACQVCAAPLEKCPQCEQPFAVKQHVYTDL